MPSPWVTRSQRDARHHVRRPAESTLNDRVRADDVLRERVTVAGQSFTIEALRRQAEER